MAKSTCSVDGCTRRATKREWCARHYHRWLLHGSPDDPTSLSDLERFWAKVDRTGGPDACWPWTASRVDNYGKFVAGGKLHRAHRWIYEQINGPVPPGLVLDHFRCDNPPCCNPTHVRPTTRANNVLRSAIATSAVNARKTHCIQGHPFDEANTYRAPGAPGKRLCRECRKHPSKPT